MDVVFASNDNYARHLAVAMYSLMDHNQVAERIRIFILSVDISRENQEKLSAVVYTGNHLYSHGKSQRKISL